MPDMAYRNVSNAHVWIAICRIWIKDILWFWVFCVILCYSVYDLRCSCSYRLLYLIYTFLFLTDIWLPNMHCRHASNSHVWIVVSVNCFGYYCRTIGTINCTENSKILSDDHKTVGVKPIIHQSELRTYTKVVPFQEKSSFHFVVLWILLNGMEWLKLIIEVKYIGIILSPHLMDLVVF